MIFPDKVSFSEAARVKILRANVPFSCAAPLKKKRPKIWSIKRKVLSLQAKKQNKQTLNQDADNQDFK